MAVTPIGRGHLYADASAVLAWLLREPRAEEVATILAEASGVLSSELTLVECDRTLLRLASEDIFAETMREELAARLATAAASWTQLGITPGILLRARLPFAGSPVRPSTPSTSRALSRAARRCPASLLCRSTIGCAALREGWGSRSCRTEAAQASLSAPC